MNQSGLNKLKVYEQLLFKWQRSVNLVAPSTLEFAWLRHFEDSLQILPFLDGVNVLADMGSGAGFPGLVVAIMRPDMQVNLIESDGKKAAFLSTVSREIGLENVNVHNGRIEKILPALRAEVVSARALASLDALLGMSQSQWERSPCPARLVFLKGADFEREILEAKERYDFKVDVEPSRTDKSGRILCISDVRVRGAA